MKQKGFRYIPYVPPEDPMTDDERKRRAGDYEALKAQRAKYGFGVFSVYVYLKGPDAPDFMPDLSGADPNGDIWTKLSPAQRTSYWKAVDACIVDAAKRVLGKELKSGEDLLAQSAAAERAGKRAILDDLECGKDFYRVYTPKLEAIHQKVAEEFGN
ncbi:hypothetical protein ABZ815_50830 [Nonomuraea sp. NPDC047529]|uniref:hypothetical protein n=1 Tax=Nonomuraea sp. NPDC047529 TaxID=3155623 RepID=UPI0033DB5907